MGRKYSDSINQDISSVGRATYFKYVGQWFDSITFYCVRYTASHGAENTPNYQVLSCSQEAERFNQIKS